MKRKKETDSSSRVYLKSWELKFPWITKGYGANGEERAVCKWCQKDLDVHSSGLSKHENSAKHKLVAKSVAGLHSQEQPRGSMDEDTVASQDMAKDLSMHRNTVESTVLQGNFLEHHQDEKQIAISFVDETSKKIIQVGRRSAESAAVSVQPPAHLVESADIPTVFDLPNQSVTSHLLSAPHSINHDASHHQVIATVDASHNFLEATKASEQVVMGEDLSMTGGISVSLPVTGDLLKGVEVLAEGGETITLNKVPVLENEVPVIPMCKLNANAQQMAWYQQQLKESLLTGQDHDVAWFCQDGTIFRAHKFVLAAFSDNLASIMSEEAVLSSIYTPDLSSEMVRAILCLMYTGQINVTWKLLQEINNAFKLIGFCGKDLTATPTQIGSADDSMNVVFTYSEELHDENSEEPVDDIVYTPIKFNESLGSTNRISNNVLLSGSMFSSHHAATLLTPAQLEDQEFIFDDSNNFLLPDPPDLDTELDHVTPEHKHALPILHSNQQQQRAIKIEIDEDEENQIPKPKKPKLEKIENIDITESPVNTSCTVSKKNVKSFKKDLDVLFNRAVITDNHEVTRIEEEDQKKRIRTDKESQVTYAVCRKDRGILSRSLAFDLFDNDEFASKVKIITVCPMCFKVFDDRDKMKDHKTAFHNTDIKGMPNQNSMILSKNKFKCRKCEETLELKHLVWFVKHYKFCGVDDVKANELLRLEDVEEKVTKPSPMEKKNTREMDFLYVMDKPKLKEMSRILLGRICEAVWGCRKCYQAFDSEDSLFNHVTSSHEGRIEHGTSYDPETKLYTCMNCKVYKTNKSVVYFIYHLSRCNVQEQGAIPIDDEEDVDEDTNDDLVDPWGVVFKPLKVNSDRSKWICEALFGEVYSILYPCHICYSVFKLEEELREHFRITHPGQQNYPEHGSQYDEDIGGFNCPTCKRNVCKKQKSSIFFAYHMQKCNGKTLPVHRKCVECNKSFSVFSTYQYHMQTKCGTTNFVCHICGIALKNFNGLRCHVMYSHSDVRPYPCNVCGKSFKRSADLDHHMKLHMGSLDWSCEKCGKAFPVKKSLRNHMKMHYTESEKPHVCHICGNRFAYKKFLTNHMTTHSTFRGFECEICKSQVKTRDTLKLHRKKVHKLSTPIPDACILQPDPSLLLQQDTPVLIARSTSIRHRAAGGAGTLLATLVTDPLHIKEEEVLPMLGEELELA